MQIRVTKVSIEDAGERFRGKLLNVRVNLKLWPDGVDIKTAQPVFDQNLDTKYPTEVEGKTSDELRLCWREKTKEALRIMVKKYKNQQTQQTQINELSPVVDATLAEINIEE